ncbi:ABC transporter ATP-binding protein [Nocardioides lijunqiniae]|uniref:ABC transporter ATP-binding protein n=1 Tax=Nocardioides lijunqiniae TaxID=2760832 RepID=UPI001878C3B5|nr:ATP-binding cassette domain-containing protein [Nocardioides lijunqiniae]
MIELQHLTKQYGSKTVVEDLTVTVKPGVVTGFLGPNGAGKSTTMRMLVGLEEPTSGRATVNGRSYRDHPLPIRELGVLLDAGARHPGRSARNHLLAQAHTHGLPASRVDEMLELVGLADVGKDRVGGFSLGMGQRLGIAGALLGDPQTVVLDEPVNGLDPDGIRWIRELLRSLAAEGRTVFVSSHLMTEMAMTAEHLVIVGRGKLIADLPVAELMSRSIRSVRVRSPQAALLQPLLTGHGVTVTTEPDGSLDVIGLTPGEIGARASEASIPVHELSSNQASLEEAFMELTRDAVEYAGETTTTVHPADERTAR